MGLYSGYCCDKCGKAIEYNKTIKQWLPNKTNLIRFARQDNWSIGKQILCPDCRKRGRE